LPDAGEAGSECNVRDAELCSAEKSSGSLCTVCASEREGASAKLCREHACEVTACVAEARGEPRDSFAFDDSVTDKPHSSGREIVVKVPIGGARYGVRLAPLAGAQAGFVGRRGGAVEVHVARFRGNGWATGATIDPSGMHAGNELPVEAGIARAERPVLLIEAHRGGGHSSRVPPLACVDQRKSDISVETSQQLIVRKAG